MPSLEEVVVADVEVDEVEMRRSADEVCGVDEATLRGSRVPRAALLVARRGVHGHRGQRCGVPREELGRHFPFFPPSRALADRWCVIRRPNLGKPLPLCLLADPL